MKNILTLIPTLLLATSASFAEIGANATIKSGDMIYAVGRDVTTLRKVVAAQSGGTFVLRDFDGSLQSGWSKKDIAITSGCSMGLCVGQKVYAVGFDHSELRTVVGLQSNGAFVLKESDGSIQSGWRKKDIAVTSGCSAGFCVGQKIYALGYDYTEVRTIVALKIDGTFVLRDREGSTQSGWTAQKLAPIK